MTVESNDTRTDNTPDSYDNDTTVAEPASPDDNSPPSTGIGWRAALVVVAVFVAALLAYPTIQQSLSQSAEQNAASDGATPPIVATALADPDSAEAQFNLGNYYVNNGLLDSAVVAYQRAIELDPLYQGAYANLGVVYYQQGEFELAASQYEKALELDSTDGDVVYNLGALYLQQALSGGGPPDIDLINQSVTQLQAAIALDPSLAEPYFTLGVAYITLNQPADAITAFETYLELDKGTDPRASQEAQRYLDSLRTQ